MEPDSGMPTFRIARTVPAGPVPVPVFRPGEAFEALCRSASYDSPSSDQVWAGFGDRWGVRFLVVAIQTGTNWPPAQVGQIAF